MENINYINLFDINKKIEDFELSNIVLSFSNNIEKIIINHNNSPLFFLISDFFIDLNNQYIKLNTNNVKYNTLNSNIKKLQSDISLKIIKNRTIKDYYKEKNLFEYNDFQIKFEKEKVIFFDLHNKKLNIFDIINNGDFNKIFNNRKCSIIVQPRLIFNHYKKKIDLQYYTYQIKMYQEKIITFKNINIIECLIKDDQHLKCPICYCKIDLQYNGTTKLYCNHIFHYNCINKWFKQKEINNEELKCPVCRKKHNINEI